MNYTLPVGNLVPLDTVLLKDLQHGLGQVRVPYT